MRFKKIAGFLLFVVTLVIASPSHARICGIGKVVEVREGGWNLDDLLVKLDYSVEGPFTALVGTNYEDVWIRYQATSLSTERLRGIRALAYLALATGKSVYVWTHNPTGCTDATELSVFNEGTNPRTVGRVE